jgi:hypothetical protein
MNGIIFYNPPRGEGATALLDSAGNDTFVGTIEGFQLTGP